MLAFFNGMNRVRSARAPRRKASPVAEALESRALLSASAGASAGGDEVRFATFNASLNRAAEGQLVADLSAGANQQARNVAEVIQRVNPDVLLVNEFDYVPGGKAAELFRDNYLAVGQGGAAPVDYPYYFVAPSNTGVASGFDLNNNGQAVTTPGAPGYGDDSLGFGAFPGQFGMVVYSKFPIATADVRTFQEFLWKDMPGALLPDDPATPEPADWYSPEELDVFRLSSKSHWDVPVVVDGRTVHVLASHPTPPVFDGPEDRNGRRNFDEIRFWADYVSADPDAAGYIYDDAGARGGLARGARFVVMGDQNSDPLDGDSIPGAIQQLLEHPRVNTRITPDSDGAVDATERQGGANLTHESDPRFDTADFADTQPGNLRADYVLPGNNFKMLDAGVFWPEKDDDLFRLVGDFDPAVPGGFPSSDHRLVFADVRVAGRPDGAGAPGGPGSPGRPDVDRRSVAGVEFIGDVSFPTGTEFDDTVVGGLSGIDYDPAADAYYAVADDRSEFDPARFYTLDVDLADGALDDGDVTFTDVTSLTREDGSLFPALSLDPEGIALAGGGTLYVSSEGEATDARQTNPFVNEFSLGGRQLDALPVDDKFDPTNNAGTTGIRNNLAFESLTITPDGRFLYTATENALKQDGPAATVNGGSTSRIVKYDLLTGLPVAEYAYVVDPVAAAPVPAGAFATNGLVELLALDNAGTLLSLERSFSVGVGNTIKLYETTTRGAVDVGGVESLDGLEPDPVAEKELVLDLADLGIPLDNVEGMTLGPVVDGEQTLILVSDNNFSGTQFTQFLAFTIDLKTTPAALPVAETPVVIDADVPGVTPGDIDDPAIYVNRRKTPRSFVIGTLKDGGLQTYDLDGRVLQTIAPEELGGVRYNNVDVLYDVAFGRGGKQDVAVVSDRENDTLAAFAVNAKRRTLREIPVAGGGLDPIFAGDGEATAYGLATYRSPETGKTFAFVTQASGNAVKQFELSGTKRGGLEAALVRTIPLPIPGGEDDAAEAQSEAMVVDQELGQLYIAEENYGILKIGAEPDVSPDELELIHSVEEDYLRPDVEGLTIYYGRSGAGHLIASSQGDDTYAVFGRAGDNAYQGSFYVGANREAGIDSAEETDGVEVTNVNLGGPFAQGLLIVQDGNDDPQSVNVDDDEVENSAGNFKLVPWAGVAEALGPVAIAGHNDDGDGVDEDEDRAGKNPYWQAPESASALPARRARSAPAPAPRAAADLLTGAGDRDEDDRQRGASGLVG